MSDEPTPSKQLLTLTELLERPGWTRAGVTRFLGDPDATKPNPRYRSAAPTRLYDPARVEATEATPEFGSWRAASEARSAKAAQAAAVRAEETVQYAGTMPLTLHAQFGLSQAAAAAGQDWLAQKVARGEYAAELPDRSNSDFWDRITINWLRHQSTNYERALAELAGKPGMDDAYSVIRQRVLDLIADRYPSLADECCRQS